MAIYKTRWFDRWAKKQGISTHVLCEAVREMTDGLCADELMEVNCDEKDKISDS